MIGDQVDSLPTAVSTTVHSPHQLEVLLIAQPSGSPSKPCLFQEMLISFTLRFPSPWTQEMSRRGAAGSRHTGNNSNQPLVGREGRKLWNANIHIQNTLLSIPFCSRANSPTHTPRRPVRTHLHGSPGSSEGTWKVLSGSWLPAAIGSTQ